MEPHAKGVRWEQWEGAGARRSFREAVQKGVDATRGTALPLALPRRPGAAEGRAVESRE
jgi:hypothetical protein